MTQGVSPAVQLVTSSASNAPVATSFSTCLSSATTSVQTALTATQQRTSVFCATILAKPAQTTLLIRVLFASQDTMSEAHSVSKPANSESSWSTTLAEHAILSVAVVLEYWTHNVSLAMTTPQVTLGTSSMSMLALMFALMGTTGTNLIESASPVNRNVPLVPPGTTVCLAFMGHTSSTVASVLTLLALKGSIVP